MNGLKESDGWKERAEEEWDRGVSKAVGESSAWLSSLSAVTTCSSKRYRLQDHSGA